MGFVTLDNIPGQIWIPDNIENSKKKHNCADCFSCQFCSDERCDLCLNRKKCKNKSVGEECELTQ